MNNFSGSIVTIAIAVIGVAIVAVLVSNNAQTGNIITKSTTGFSNVLKAAISPVVGGGGASSVPTLYA